MIIIIICYDKFFCVSSNFRSFVDNLGDFIVGVTNTTPAIDDPPTNFDVCAFHSGDASTGQSVRIHCVPSTVRGQHVFIRSYGQDKTLALCEVVVFGEGKC